MRLAGIKETKIAPLPREGQRESSYRSFPLGVVTDVGLEEAIPEYLERLMPFSSVLQAFVSSGGIASIAIGWFGDSDVGGGSSLGRLCRRHGETAPDTRPLFVFRAERIETCSNRYLMRFSGPSSPALQGR